MGINDRDYMKEPGNDNIINLNQLALVAVKSVVVLVALLVSLRFPMIWLKLGLVILVLIFGIRWIFFPKKKPKKTNANPSRAQSSRPARSTSSQPVVHDDVVQQLIVLDAAGEFGKAKTLIQSLDGKEFPKQIAERLLPIAKNYFPVAINESENGYRFNLTKSEEL